jgi:hypothetical protein
MLERIGDHHLGTDLTTDLFYPDHGVEYIPRIFTHFSDNDFTAVDRCLEFGDDTVAT